MKLITFITTVLIVFTGCATAHQEADNTNIAHSTSEESVEVKTSGQIVTGTEEINPGLSHMNTLQDNSLYDDSSANTYTGKNENQPRLAESLLNSSSEIMHEDELKKILSSRVVLPSKGHLAIVKFPGHEGANEMYFGGGYWRSEAYLKTQQEFIDDLSLQLTKSDRIVAVTLVPRLLSPGDATIPVLREAAVRLRADLLLAFRITSDIYQDYMRSDLDKAKAFSTCEAVLIDIRTGLIPYTTVVTGESMQELTTEDTSINKTRMRAEKEAVLTSLRVVANEITEFLRSVP